MQCDGVDTRIPQIGATALDELSRRDLELAAVRIDAGLGVAMARVAQDLGQERRRALALRTEDLEVLGLELAGDHDALIGEQRLAGDASAWLEAQELVQHGIGDAVGELVGMAFGNGLGGEQTVANQQSSSAAFDDSSGPGMWFQTSRSFPRDGRPTSQGTHRSKINWGRASAPLQTIAFCSNRAPSSLASSHEMPSTRTLGSPGQPFDG